MQTSCHAEYITLESAGTLFTELSYYQLISTHYKTLHLLSVA